MLRREAKGFFIATRFLPRRKRDAIEAIYGLLRYADDLADEPGPTPQERVSALRDVMETVAAIRDPGAQSEAPWFPAVRRAFARFPIRIEDAMRVLEACLSDVDAATYETLDDLEHYASAVAGSVGRCAVAILGASDADSLERANRLGIAMQLTNVLRDVAADADRGRSYIPKTLQATDDRGAAVIAQRARTRYAQAKPLLVRLPNDGSRLAVAIAADLYEAALTKRLSPTQRALHVARCMVQCVRN